MNPSASRHHQLSGKYLYSQLEVDQGVWVTSPHWWLQYYPDQGLAFRWFCSNILPWKNRQIVFFSPRLFLVNHFLRIFYNICFCKQAGSLGWHVLLLVGSVRRRFSAVEECSPSASRSHSSLLGIQLGLLLHRQHSAAGTPPLCRCTDCCFLPPFQEHTGTFLASRLTWCASSASDFLGAAASSH